MISATSPAFKKIISVDEVLLNHQIAYFAQYFGNAEALIDICSEVRAKNDKKLWGVKFPLGIVTEAILKYAFISKDENFLKLADKLLDFLLERFENSGFNYFENKYLPEDLDTTSLLTRLLHRKHSSLRIAYEKIVSRNITDKGLIPTWLDTNDYQKWFSGETPYHIDVLLNYWLTEITLGKEVNPLIILNSVNEFRLNNYWYFPSLYSSYLYFRIIISLELYRDLQYLFPLISRIKEWDTDKISLFSKSNICKYEKVNEISSTGSLADNLLDNTWRNSMVLFLRESGLTEFDTEVEFEPDAQTAAYKDIPLYWSLGFATFSSEPVSRAMILSTLSEI
jgi:hypothetical protein